MVSIDDAHLDHAWPKFSHIVCGFRAARGWSSDIPDGIVSPPADGQLKPTFVDQAVADAFRDYHHNQAMLRILSKKANLQTASQARRPKIARPVRLVGQVLNGWSVFLFPLLGVHEYRAIYLLHNGILKDKSIAGDNVLTGLVLDALPEFSGSKTPVNGNDKAHHHWGQSVEGMDELVRRFTFPGQVVLEPFLAGGTRAIAALCNHCSFVGFDANNRCVEITRERIANEGVVV